MDRSRRVETIDVLLVDAGSCNTDVEATFFVADLLANFPNILLESSNE